MVKKRERTEAEIPTSSMADIAFLLLIFFLVTTTIDVDTGIVMQLPPPLEDEEPPPPIQERNLLKVLVNDEGQILVEDEPQNLASVRSQVIAHVTNNGRDPRYAVRPGLAIVSLKTTRATNYLDFINVLDEMQMAYKEIRDQEARNMGYSGYEDYVSRLEPDAPNLIQEKFKIKISLAEPDQG